ncbi:MAG: hypothetical protein IJ168_10740 [Eubacterium sp.]|nr:hypothetical protein [Eubacterium sp.]
MEFLKENWYLLLTTFVAVACRWFYVFAIYANSKALSKNRPALYFVLALFFPVITGFVLLFQQKKVDKNNDDYRRSLRYFVVAACLFAVLCGLTAYGAARRLDEDKEETYFDENITFYDAEHNAYQFDFENKGFDYLFDEEAQPLDADLCYLDSNNLLYFDGDMNITVDSEGHCVDGQGNVYCPVRYVQLDGNGDYVTEFVDQKPYYDREGKAYVYSNVPFYNNAGDKYYFSIASGETSGVFTNLTTGEEIDGSNAFVDENGYLLAPEPVTLTKTAHGQWLDADENVYYSATAVQWTEDGTLTYIGLE